MCRKMIFLVLLLAFVMSSSVYAATIIWVSDNKNADYRDQGWIDVLVAQGYDVNLNFRNQEARTLDATKIATLNAADLIIVCRDLDSGFYDDDDEVTQWNSITTPLLLQVAHIMRSSRWRWLDTTSTSKGLVPLEAVEPSHYVFTGVTLDASNQVDILIEKVDLGDHTDPGNGTLIGRRADNGGVWIVEWEAGVEFYPGSGQYAGGPRMYFPADQEYTLTAEGEKVFLNAVGYMLGAAEPAPVTIPVEAGGDIAAANAAAVAGDVIDIAAGTFAITEQIEIKDGVTYQGAGADLTVIDGGNLTRAFTAWGDSGATNGQVDANGDSVPNLTGPTGWVLDGMTIQNCVADAASRQDILSAARDLLNNYTGAPYTLATAQAENGGITDNPGWFDILSGSADDDLTDVELQAYLDANPVGSAGHLVANDGMNTGGGGLVLRNGAAGTVQNCSFLNNQAPLNSGDGGAINAGGSGVALTIDNCEFIGNSVDDGGGALRLNSSSACTITGTIFTGNQAVMNSGDGGAIQVANAGTTLTVDNCEFNGNSCIDGGGSIRLGATGSVQTITGSTFTGNYIIDGSGDGGAIKIDGDDSTYVLTDCTFTGNYAADDGGAVRYGPDRSELTVTNCAFIGNAKDADGNVVGDDGGTWSTNDDDCGPMTFMNCLFADNACNDDRLIELKAVFSMLNCTFIGNVAGDKALIAVRGRPWDSTGDGVDDVTTDDSIISNCLFINNTMLSDKNVIGDTRDDVFAPTVTNCLFFGNLDGSNPANNTDNNSTEVGTIDVSAVTDAAQIVVDPAGDYHLAAGSPAIDASDPATATATDIEGTPAVGVRDVGAYEAP